MRRALAVWIGAVLAASVLAVPAVRPAAEAAVVATGTEAPPAPAPQRMAVRPTTTSTSAPATTTSSSSASAAPPSTSGSVARSTDTEPAPTVGTVELPERPTTEAPAAGTPPVPPETAPPASPSDPPSDAELPPPPTFVPGASVTSRTVDPEGNPVAGLCVAEYGVVSGRSFSNVTTTSAADGSFTLPVLNTEYPGAAIVTARSCGYPDRPTWTEWHLPEPTIGDLSSGSVLEVHRHFWLEGYVVGTDGEPVGGVLCIDLPHGWTASVISDSGWFGSEVEGPATPGEPPYVASFRAHPCGQPDRDIGSSTATATIDWGGRAEITIVVADPPNPG